MASCRSVETITCKEPLLVQEVTSVLKEWHAIWKQLFVVSSAFKYGYGRVLKGGFELLIF